MERPAPILITAGALCVAALAAVPFFGGEFVLPVKENRRALFDALDALPWGQVPIARTATDKGHGRITTRTIQVLPAPEDLMELRGSGRDRVARTLDTFAGEFTLEKQDRVTSTADLDAASVRDVLHSIYRPIRAQPVGAMRVTFSLDLLLFRAGR